MSLLDANHEREIEQEEQRTLRREELISYLERDRMPAYQLEELEALFVELLEKELRPLFLRLALAQFGTDTKIKLAQSAVLAQLDSIFFSALNKVASG